MQRIRLIGLALLAMFAIAVTAASAASAHSFKAQTYPDTVRAHAINPQGFQISGSVSVCSKATFEGTATAASETLEVHPKYEGCEVELAGTFKAKVNTEGCNYLFHAATPLTQEGSVDVVCQTGKEINVVVEGIEGGCSIKIPGQTGLKTIEYVNEGTGSTAKTEVNARVSGIAWTTTGACGLKESAGTNGEYREGKTSSLGIPELGTGPASALSEGFNELEEPDGILVE
jgi:hypothetical protein